MTLEELKANYTVAYRIIMRERALRDNAFATAEEAQQDMAEMDKLLEVVTDLKDELKRRMLAEPEQATLLDVVRGAKYP